MYGSSRRRFQYHHRQRAVQAKTPTATTTAAAALVAVAFASVATSWTGPDISRAASPRWPFLPRTTRLDDSSSFPQRHPPNRLVSVPLVSVPTSPIPPTPLLHPIASGEASGSPRERRTRQTWVDEYIRQNGKVPDPTVKHLILPVSYCSASKAQSPLVEKSTATTTPFGILVVGDVHGCLDELVLLHQKAVALNQNRPFQHVILVGDLCNKGPDSAAVIRHVRTHASQGWWTVRGNHDNGALYHAVMSEAATNRGAKYKWLYDETGASALEDEDIVWLAQLPYTIRLCPTTALETDANETLIVHAGLLPTVALDEQSIETMVTVRDIPRDSDASSMVAWASQWQGPERIIFGHDAKRGLQQTQYCIGLDTGAVYGKQLTGIILPQGQLVQVDALQVYCPIDET